MEPIDSRAELCEGNAAGEFAAWPLLQAMTDRPSAQHFEELADQQHSLTRKSRGSPPTPESIKEEHPESRSSLAVGGAARLKAREARSVGWNSNRRHRRGEHSCTAFARTQYPRPRGESQVLLNSSPQNPERV